MFEFTDRWAFDRARGVVGDIERVFGVRQLQDTLEREVGMPLETLKDYRPLGLIEASAVAAALAATVAAAPERRASKRFLGADGSGTPVTPLGSGSSVDGGSVDGFTLGGGGRARSGSRGSGDDRSSTGGDSASVADDDGSTIADGESGGASAGKRRKHRKTTGASSAAQQQHGVDDLVDFEPTVATKRVLVTLGGEPVLPPPGAATEQLLAPVTAWLLARLTAPPGSVLARRRPRSGSTGSDSTAASTASAGSRAPPVAVLVRVAAAIDRSVPLARPAAVSQRHYGAFLLRARGVPMPLLPGQLVQHAAAATGAGAGSSSSAASSVVGALPAQGYLPVQIAAARYATVSVASSEAARTAPAAPAPTVVAAADYVAAVGLQPAVYAELLLAGLGLQPLPVAGAGGASSAAGSAASEADADTGAPQLAPSPLPPPIDTSGGGAPAEPASSAAAAPTPAATSVAASPISSSSAPSLVSAAPAPQLRRCGLCDCMDNKRKPLKLHPCVSVTATGAPVFLCDRCREALLEARARATARGYLQDTGPFPDGYESLCAFCGVGGPEVVPPLQLVCCSCPRCPRAYCAECTRRLMGGSKRAAGALEGEDEWLCPPCGVATVVRLAGGASATVDDEASQAAVAAAATAAAAASAAGADGDAAAGDVGMLDEMAGASDGVDPAAAGVDDGSSSAAATTSSSSSSAATGGGSTSRGKRGKPPRGKAASSAASSNAAPAVTSAAFQPSAPWLPSPTGASSGGVLLTVDTAPEDMFRYFAAYAREVRYRILAQAAKYCRRLVAWEVYDAVAPTLLGVPVASPTGASPAAAAAAPTSSSTKSAFTPVAGSGGGRAALVAAAAAATAPPPGQLYLPPGTEAPSIFGNPPRVLGSPELETAPSEDTCFVCHDGGELAVCDVRRRTPAGIIHCPKVYHVDCLAPDLRPPGDENVKWRCPRHTCKGCPTRGASKVFCRYCPASWCEAHAGEAHAEAMAAATAVAAAKVPRGGARPAVDAVSQPGSGIVVLTSQPLRLACPDVPDSGVLVLCPTCAVARAGAVARGLLEPDPLEGFPTPLQPPAVAAAAAAAGAGANPPSSSSSAAAAATSPGHSASSSAAAASKGGPRALPFDVWLATRSHGNGGGGGSAKKDRPAGARAGAAAEDDAPAAAPAQEAAAQQLAPAPVPSAPSPTTPSAAAPPATVPPATEEAAAAALATSPVPLPHRGGATPAHASAPAPPPPAAAAAAPAPAAGAPAASAPTQVAVMLPVDLIRRMLSGEIAIPAGLADKRALLEAALAAHSADGGGGSK